MVVLNLKDMQNTIFQVDSDYGIWPTDKLGILTVDFTFGFLIEVLFELRYWIKIFLAAIKANSFALREEIIKNVNFELIWSLYISHCHIILLFFLVHVKVILLVEHNFTILIL